MSYSTTEHTQVVIEAALLFLLGELTVFSKLVGEGGRATGGRGRLSKFGLPGRLVAVLVGVTRTRCGSLTFVVRLVLPGMELFMVSFPVLGVDGMSKNLYGFESGAFAMLTHNIFDAFSKPRIITVTEDTIIPTGVDSETVELNIILDDMLVVLHLKIVNLEYHWS